MLTIYQILNIIRSVTYFHQVTLCILYNAGMDYTNISKSKKKKKTKNRKRMAGVKLGNITRSSEDNLEVRIVQRYVYYTT